MSGQEVGGNEGEEAMDMMEDVEEDSSESEEEEGEGSGKHDKVYLPGGPMEDNEELMMDESAYVMYHQAQTGAPCLSFDCIGDPLGDDRDTYPLTMFLVAGTQAERSNANRVVVMKMSNLKKTCSEINEDENDSGEEDEEDREADLPKLSTSMLKHNGGVNRIRNVAIGEQTIAATWSELARVDIWDLTPHLKAVNNLSGTDNQLKLDAPPVFTFAGHQTEGFALDWSPVDVGALATGDCTKNIHLWKPQEGGSWHVDQRPCVGHTASVEDIQWSPTEATVFASCSVDKSIRVWDSRAPPMTSCMLTSAEAHDRDVNVISWNKNEPFIVSGGDDGMIKIWDLRLFKDGKPVAVFKHHTAPITSVEWHHQDSSVFAASGSDDQLTIWDLALERDDEAQSSDEPKVPPQLMFIHQGQKDTKELHWHKQCPGVIISTAQDGFNIFRTISV